MNNGDNKQQPNNNPMHRQPNGQPPVRPQMGNRQPVRPQMGNQQQGRPQPVRPQGAPPPNQRQMNRPMQGQGQGQGQGQMRQPRPQNGGQQGFGPQGGFGQQGFGPQNGGMQGVGGNQYQQQGEQLPLGDTYQQSNKYQQDNAYENQNMQLMNTGNEFEDINSELVHDTVAENKQRGKKVKVKKEKKPLTPEQKKKIKIVAIVVAALAVVGIAAFILLRNVMSDSSKHLNLVDPSQQSNIAEDNDTGDDTGEVVDDTEENTPDESDTSENQEVDNENQEETPVKPVTNIEARKSSEDNPLALNEYTDIDLIINTKTATDKTYTDHETKIYIKLSNVVCGFDDVAKYIEDYNNKVKEYAKINKGTQLKVINVPDKNKYYEQSAGTEIVMYEFEVLYPSDYPTNASEGKVYRIPKCSLDVFGTVDEIDIDNLEEDTSKYIVVDDTVYNVSNITDISMILNSKSKEAQFNVGEPLYFRFITSVPIGASKDVYGMKLNFYLDSEDLDIDTNEMILTNTIYIEGQKIESSASYVYEADMNTEDSNSGNTEETESSGENTGEGSSEESETPDNSETSE